MYFGKFPNVKEFVAVNAKSSKNVPNLLRLVVSLAQQDPSQQELVPASFLQVSYLLRFFVPTPSFPPQMLAINSFPFPFKYYVGSL